MKQSVLEKLAEEEKYRAIVTEKQIHGFFPIIYHVFTWS